MSRIWLLLAMAACGSAQAPPPPELGDTRARAVHASSPYSGRLRFHMRNHREDLAQLDHLLATGRLAEAKTLAYLLTRPAPDLGMSIDGVRTRSSALALWRSETVEEACERARDLVAACTACHDRLGVKPRLEHPFACRR